MNVRSPARWHLGRGDAGLHLAALAAVTASFILTPDGIANGPVVCPFRLATDLPCPACGFTRSFVALAHGDARAAFAYNAFGPLLFTAFVAMLLVRVHGIAVGPVRPVRVDGGWRWVMYALLAVWLAWAIVRAATS